MIHMQKKTATSIVLRALALILLLSSMLGAQVSASITGIVRDATGASVSGVKVSATNQDRGMVRSTATNKRGQYVLFSLPVGRYDVRMEKAGFKAEIRKDISL